MVHRRGTVVILYDQIPSLLCVPQRLKYPSSLFSLLISKQLKKNLVPDAIICCNNAESTDAALETAVGLPDHLLPLVLFRTYSTDRM